VRLGDDSDHIETYKFVGDVSSFVIFTRKVLCHGVV
jgi:hypothetical protein